MVLEAIGHVFNIRLLLQMSVITFCIILVYHLRCGIIFCLDMSHVGYVCLFRRKKNQIRPYTGCPKIIVLHLCGYGGGAEDSMISVSTQLHRSSFNLEFDTLL